MMTAGGNAWTTTQAYLMGVICLALGVAVGFLMRGSATAATITNHPATRPIAQPQPTVIAPPLSNPQPSPAEMKNASAQAAMPILARLEAKPKDFKLLLQAGEMYYQHGAYAEAAGYYDRALAVQDNAAVRNQYASALFYQGDADGALREYANVLQAQPANDIALFNSGMVKYRAKNDAKGAVELWQKLLNTNPNHPQRDRIQKMIDKAAQSLN
jgi:tetratricopeptide (TPR) repeat protein